MGIVPKSNAHIVALPDGMPIIRVRPVKRLPIDARCIAQSIQGITTTTRQPNPTDPTQNIALTESQTEGVKIGVDGSKLPKDDGMIVEEAPPMDTREFKITKNAVEKYVWTPDCLVCEGFSLDQDRNIVPSV